MNAAYSCQFQTCAKLRYLRKNAESRGLKFEQYRHAMHTFLQQNYTVVQARTEQRALIRGAGRSVPSNAPLTLSVVR